MEGSETNFEDVERDLQHYVANNFSDGRNSHSAAAYTSSNSFINTSAFNPTPTAPEPEAEINLHSQTGNEHSEDDWVLPPRQSGLSAHETSSDSSRMQQQTVSIPPNDQDDFISEPELNPDRAVDLAELAKMLEQHKQHSNGCRDQDVVFFLGNTGAGKSMTINYLCGRKIVKMTEAESDFSERMEVENPLDGCMVGHTADSTTRFLRSFQDPHTGLVLCDTPGFEDTEGHLIDTANAVAIASTIRNCRSVRLVLLIEGSVITSARGKALKDLLLLIQRFINDAQNHLFSVLPLFTHCAEFTPRKIQNNLERFLSATHFQDAKPFLQYVISSLTRHAEALLLRPAGSEGETLLPRVRQLIMDIKPIVDIRSALNSPLSESAKTSLILSCKSMAAQMERNFRSKRSIAAFSDELDELRLLSEALDVQEVSSNYSHVCKILTEHIVKACNEARDAITQARFVDAAHYLSALNRFDCLHDHYTKVYPELRAREYTTLLRELNQFVTTLGLEIQDQSTDIKVLHDHLDKLASVNQLLSDYIDKSQRQAYLKSVSVTAARFQKTAESAIELIQHRNFASELLGKQLCDLQLLPMLGAHIKDAMYYKHCVTSMDSIIRSTFDSIMQSLRAPLSEAASRDLAVNMQTMIASQSIDTVHFPEAQTLAVQCLSRLDDVINERFASLDLALTQQRNEEAAVCLTQLQLLDIKEDTAFRTRYQDKLRDILVRWENDVMAIRSLLERPSFSEEIYSQAVDKMHSFHSALEHLCKFVPERISGFAAEYQQWKTRITQWHTEVVEEGMASFGQGSEATEEPGKTVVFMARIEHILNIHLRFDTGTAPMFKRFAVCLIDHLVQSCNICIAKTRRVHRIGSIEEAHARLVMLRSYLAHLSAASTSRQTFACVFELSAVKTELQQSIGTPRNIQAQGVCSTSPSEATTVKKPAGRGKKTGDARGGRGRGGSAAGGLINSIKCALNFSTVSVEESNQTMATEEDNVDLSNQSTAIQSSNSARFAPEAPSPRPRDLAELLQALEGCLDLSKCNLQERANEMMLEAESSLASHDFSSVHSMLVCLQRLECFESLCEVTLLDRHKAVIVRAKEMLTAFNMAFDSSLRSEQMESARQALSDVHAMAVLQDFVELVGDTYNRLNSAFQEKTSQFNATVDDLIICKNFQKLAKIIAGHKELEHSVPTARHELCTASQQLIEFFNTRFELGWQAIHSMTSTKQLPQTKLTEISEVIKNFVDADALFKVFGDEAPFRTWEENMVKTLKQKLTLIVQNADTCIRNLDLKGFDSAVSYLESLQVISLIAQDCGVSIEALNASMLARINGLEAELTAAIDGLEHRSIDKIFNGLLRGLDLNTIAGLRLDQEYDSLVMVLERELKKLCDQIKQSLAKYDIKDAHRNIEQFRSLLVSEYVKKTQFNSDVLQRFCFDMDEIKAEILSTRLVVEDPEKISYYLEGFKEVDHRFYKRQRDGFLDKLKDQIYECGKQVASKDIRNLKGLEQRLKELKCYEIALRGQGCDSEIKGYKKDLLESLTDTIEQVHNDIECMVQTSRWEDIEKLKKFFSKALPILQGCDFAEEDVKKEFIAKFEKLNIIIQEKGRNISSKWSMLESFDLADSSGMNAEELEQFLRELEKEQQFLEGRLGRDFAAQDISKAKAISQLKMRISQTMRDLQKLWCEEKYDIIQNIINRLDSLSMVDCLGREVMAALTDAQQFIKDQFSSIEAQAIEHFQQALNPRVGDISSRKAFQNANAALECVKKLQKHFGAFKQVCPQDREEEIVKLMMQATDRLADEFHALSRVPEMDLVVVFVLKLWVIPSEISNQKVKAHARAKIAHIFQKCREEGKRRKAEFNFTELASRLSSADPKGGEIVEDFNEIFRAFHTAKFRDATARMTFDDSLEKLVSLNKLSVVQAKSLQANYTRFQERFRSLLERFYTPEQIAKTVVVGAGRLEIPDTLAAIFAIWSLQMSSSAARDKDNVWATPHPVQVLALFRLLSVDSVTESGTTDFLTGLLTAISSALRSKTPDSKRGLGHLIELRTGEGKSIVLGALATFLALFGFDVDCVCYSKYLSNRDFNAFKGVFELFGVQHKISYGTFTSLSKKLVNSRCDVRSVTRDFLVSEKSDMSSSKSFTSKKRILLIDEVDVFFSEEFYGNIYAASTVLVNEHIEAVQQCIWKHRSLPQKSILDEVKRLPAYKALQKMFHSHMILIERHISEMLKDVKRVDDPDHVYKVDSEGKIAYVTQDTTSNNIVCGYKTLFAYFKEYELGSVSLEILKAAMGLHIKCGNFSYAEIPRYYDQILGVTGTLQSLGDFEKKVIENDYCIKCKTLTPSIYGDSKLTFREVSDVHCEMDEAQYNRKIKEEILTATKDERAVLVFFEDEVKLKQWKASGYAVDIEHMSTVTSNTENIDHYVKQATRAGSVTLFTAVHGRGLDFVCHDKSIDSKGGIHVVQTFLSGEYSEEIQIKGRTARQDKKGTYKLVLHIPALDRFGISPEEVEEARKSSKLYDLLHNKRNAWFARESEARSAEINRALDCHKRSVEFQNLLLQHTGEMRVLKADVPLDQRIREALLGFNDFRFGGSGGVCRLLCLSDATGSMSSLWDGAKRHIETMLERIDELAGAGRVQLKWVAYRDYSEGSRIIECSGWTAEARALLGFLNSVSCDGGGDFEEAVEAALAHANAEDALPTRVILIGDAPPHPEKTGEKLPHHAHVLATDWARECDALAEKGIPVYTFRLGDSRATAESFAKIARATSGEARDLASADDLLDVVCMQALEQVGGSELVDKYREKYLKYTFAS